MISGPILARLLHLRRVDGSPPVASSDDDDEALDWPSTEAVAPPASLAALDVQAAHTPAAPVDLTGLDAELMVLQGPAGSREARRG